MGPKPKKKCTYKTNLEKTYKILLGDIQRT